MAHHGKQAAPGRHGSQASVVAVRMRLSPLDANAGASTLTRGAYSGSRWRQDRAANRRVEQGSPTPRSERGTRACEKHGGESPTGSTAPAWAFPFASWKGVPSPTRCAHERDPSPHCHMCAFTHQFLTPWLMRSQWPIRRCMALARHLALLMRSPAPESALPQSIGPPPPLCMARRQSQRRAP